MAKKYLLSLIFLFSVLLVLVPVISLAATVTFSEDTNLNVDGVTLIVKSGATAGGITVQTTYIDVILENGSRITIASNDKKELENTLTNTVCDANQSYITLSWSQAATTSVRVTPKGTCTVVTTYTGGGGGATPTDTTAPAISNISVTTEKSSATISWTTDEASLSWLLYGTSTAYGLEKKTTTYGTSHSLALTGLLSNTTYHYQVKSKDATGNIGSYSDKTFTTKAEVVVAEAAITPAAGGEASATSAEGSKAAIKLPAQAVSANTTVTITPTAKTETAVSTAVAAVPTTQSLVGGYLYNYSAVSGTTTITTFSKSVTLTLTYTDAQISGLDESTLTVNYYDETAGKWKALTTTVDAANNTLTAATDHLTYFAIIGEPVAVTPPAAPEMTTEQLKARILEIQQLIIKILIQLIAKIQVQLAALR